MGTRDRRVDAYIGKAAPFAQPILAHLRDVVHESCPKVVETIKWNMPSFEYRGLLCGIAAFKRHCTFGFWKHELVVGDDPKAQQAMGSFGRIERLDDLPSSATLRRYVKKAMKLNEAGVAAPRRKTRPKQPVRMHPELKRALAANAKATATFDAFSPSHRREYVEWVSEAKRDETRARRIAQAVTWLAEGKPRNWKYLEC